MHKSCEQFKVKTTWPSTSESTLFGLDFFGGLEINIHVGMGCFFIKAGISIQNLSFP